MRFGHRCPNCGSFRTKRSGGTSRLHDFYEWLLIRSYRCTQCNWPFRKFALLVRPVSDRLPPPSKAEADD
jgi:transposase-like protein